MVNILLPFYLLRNFIKTTVIAKGRTMSIVAHESYKPQSVRRSTCDLGTSLESECGFFHGSVKTTRVFSKDIPK